MIFDRALKANKSIRKLLLVNNSITMKKLFFSLVFLSLIAMAGSTITAQTVQIQSAGFNYVITDPKYESGDYYDVWIFLYDPYNNYWASQTQQIGSYHAPGTKTYNGYTITFYMYASDGYQVVLFVAKNGEPVGSGNNRTGWSGILEPDGNNVVHPSTIYVNSW